MGGWMTESIKFMSSVFKVQTTVDHGIRITLDTAESNTMVMAMLAECQRMGVVLDVIALPVIQDNSQSDMADGKKSRQAVKSLRGN
jgi:hypothetical protein